MALTLFNTADGGTPKRWSNKAMLETYTNSFFLPRMMGSESARLPIAIRNELESGPGDEVTLYLAAKLTGRARQGEEKQEGHETALTDYTDKVTIDRHRKPVSVGHIMSQKRRPYDLKQSAITRVGEFWAEYLDQQFFCHLSGQRGTGTNIDYLEVGYAGFPHPFVAPDAQHRMFAGAATSEAALTVADVMNRATIERAVLKANTMIGGTTKLWKMNQVRIEGARYWAFLMHPSQMYDLRQDTGDAGWLSLEKARISAVGNNSPMFRGEQEATVLLQNAILHTHNNITYRDNYGAGANVRGYRALLLGAHALAVAFGTEDKAKDGVRMKLGEYDSDGGDEKNIKSLVVAGWKKTRFEDRDFGVISVDTSASLVAQQAQMS